MLLSILHINKQVLNLQINSKTFSILAVLLPVLIPEPVCTMGKSVCFHRSIPSEPHPMPLQLQLPHR